MPAKTSAKTTTETYHHGNLRSALLEEAGRVLEDEGADAITFRGLARNLGVSHAAPSHHFADRQELLAELGADGYAGLADAMDQAMDENPPEHWLEAIGKAYIRFGVANPELYRMMFASKLLVGDCPPRLETESTRAYLMLLKAVYGDDLDWDGATYQMGSAETAAWSMVHGAVMLWIDGQTGSLATADEFVALADRTLSDHLG